MSLPEIDYFRPKTLREAVEFLADHKEEARVLAGGTDLIILMRDGALKPKYVVDIKGIKELSTLSHNKKDGLVIGSIVTMNQLIELDVVKKYFRALWDATVTVADPILRNRATLVGNICNASPAADTAPALLIHEAEIRVVGKEGERKIPITKFFTGVKRTSLEPGEIVKSVRVPNPPEGARGGYLKWGRVRSEDLATVGVAALVANSGKTVRVALSSVFQTPVRIFEVEDIFRKKGAPTDKIEKAVSIVCNKISPISDVRSSKEYRLHMAEILTRQLLPNLLGGD